MDKRERSLKWITAFNDKKIEDIIGLYSDAIEHTSPKIANYYQLENNTIKGKALLKAYFTKALKNNPTLHFELLTILEGERSVVLLYKRMENDLAGEFLEFDEKGLIVKSCSNYKSLEQD